MRKPGRPPAGLDGKHVQHYPQLSVRVPYKTIALFKALADSTSQTLALARILEEHVGSKSPSDQKKIRKLQRRILEEASPTAKR